MLLCCCELDRAFIIQCRVCCGVLGKSCGIWHNRKKEQKMTEKANEGYSFLLINFLPGLYFHSCQQSRSCFVHKAPQSQVTDPGGSLGYI